MSYENIVYVGQMSQVTAKDFAFTKNIPSPVPPRLAQKLLRSPEFISEADFLAQQEASKPNEDAPAETSTAQAATEPEIEPDVVSNKPTFKHKRSTK